MQKEIVTTSKLIGIEITGIAILNMWGGGSGEIEMEKYFLPLEHITKDNIIRCVNDNGFGCESIESATIDIELVYKDNNSYRKIYEPDRTIELGKIHRPLFNGWAHLRQIGAIK